MQARFNQPGPSRQHSASETSTNAVTEPIGPQVVRDYGYLPRRAWITVLHFLDAESRLNVAALGKNFAALNCSESALHTIRVAANNDVCHLQRLLEKCGRRHVRVLHLTNCSAVTYGGALMANVSACDQLTELYCVGCTFDPCAFFPLVANCLRSLQRLEWTLFCCHIWKCIPDLIGVARQNPCALKFMYVQLECAEHFSNEHLLSFLHQCPRMKRLHVHTLSGTHAKSIRHWARLAKERPAGLLEFTYTTDESVHLYREFMKMPAVHERLFTHLALCGNVTYYWQGPLCFSTIVDLDQLVLGLIPPPRTSQMVLTVHAMQTAAAKLRRLAEVYTFNHIRALTLVSIPKAIVERTPPEHLLMFVPNAIAEYLCCFFTAFSAITELNLNEFHFPINLTFPSVAERSALTHLRALSLAPCALKPAMFSLEHLAVICPVLEELDIRSNFPGPFQLPCASCFSYQPFEIRKMAPGLHRLTLYNVPGFNSISFLEACCVTELRLCGLNVLLDPYLGGLGSVLKKNTKLSSLTIEHERLPVGWKAFWLELSEAKSLIFVCVLSNAQESVESVNIDVQCCMSRLPLIRGMHVHFRNYITNAPERLTILARRTDHGLVTELSVLETPACIQCSTSTFVALDKPRFCGWSNC
ncbi:hypothetical protein HPB49_008627 [Dermacentor silvarum]|uniref:Uncharacterized protein n=1 Tax=Dermacentor silvarum TaxID=543639 RepID=A0ACB8DXX2_DERSI|nr:hypothetical protein HPB49_008627 [Dermacentor silvarum]